MSTVIDFETYCDLDLKKVGIYRYMHHPSSRILCMSYKIDDASTQIWYPGLPFPKFEYKDIYAFSAMFEYCAWNIIGTKQHPEYFTPLPPSSFIDIKALCARYRMPQSLKNAGIALGCKTEKMAIGTQLIKICCGPGRTPTQQQMQELYTYCIIDTDVASEILEKLPAKVLTPKEQQLWELTVRINERGVPVDEVAVDSVIHYLATYMTDLKAILPEITDGFINTPGQIQKIIMYCAKYGINLDNLQADTVDKLLDDEETELPENVRTVLEIRKLGGSTSVKKYLKIKDHVHQGYVKDNLVYHGAGTGRWTGQGFQFHNLPRAKVDNPEEYIQRFINKEPIEKPVKIAKALIRSMITAPPGYTLIVSDYSSIENRVLAWLAKDQATLDLFAKGDCQYTDMAAFLYRKTHDQVAKDERFMGKVIILGCGYQMGATRFQAVAANFGIALTMAQCINIIKIYRQRYAKVARMWGVLHEAAIHAVRYKHTPCAAHSCTFKVVTDHTGRTWLRIVLPSGRGLMYADPIIEIGKYGPVIMYTGLVAAINKMRPIALSPGLITENIVQATARDILAEGMLALEKELPEVSLRLSVHDEVGGLVKEDLATQELLDRFNDILCKPLPWTKGLPLTAKGYISKRYKKD